MNLELINREIFCTTFTINFILIDEIVFEKEKGKRLSQKPFKTIAVFFLRHFKEGTFLD